MAACCRSRVVDAVLRRGPHVEQLARPSPSHGARRRLQRAASCRRGSRRPRPCVPSTRSFVARMDLDVVHRHGGQVALTPRPGAARGSRRRQSPRSVPTKSRSGFRGCSRTTLRRAALGEAGRDRLPGLAEVFSAEEVGLEVVAAVAVEGHVGRAFAACGSPRRGYVGPLGDARDARRPRSSRSRRRRGRPARCRRPCPPRARPPCSGDSASVVMVPKCTTPSLRDRKSLAVLPKIGSSSRSAPLVRSGLTQRPGLARGPGSRRGGCRRSRSSWGRGARPGWASSS